MGAPTPLEQRLPLVHLPTPLETLDRLGAHLGMPPGHLWVKRDDLTGLAGGGNKARKLEYLCAAALAQGCDTLVTGGGAQSNHVRMTAAAANRLGLACTVVLNGDRPDPAVGNLVLDELLGPEMVWAGKAGELDYYGVEAAIEDACRRLEAAGRRPYAMPIGGASPVGALGYVRAGLELRAQDPDFDVVVVADGSGGTHAGLVAGLGDHRAVYGVDVGARPDLEEKVPAKAAEVARLAGLPPPIGDPGPGLRGPNAEAGLRGPNARAGLRGPNAEAGLRGPNAEAGLRGPNAEAGLRGPNAEATPRGPDELPAAVVDREHIGDSYGAPTRGTWEAIRLAARTEGLILDPVYTGKAMAGLVAAVTGGRIPRDARVVFVHTGGLPALFASSLPGWLRSAL